MPGKRGLTAAKVAPLDADAICERIAGGESLNAIAMSIKRSEATVRQWLDADPERATKYACARDLRAHKLADEIIEIADDSAGDTYTDAEGNVVVDQERVARSRLRVDARKWVASKLMPRVYGDKVAQEITGANGGPLQVASVNLAGLSDADLQQLQATLAKAGALPGPGT